MLWSPRKNGLTSLFKEVRVFKGFSGGEAGVPPVGVSPKNKQGIPPKINKERTDRERILARKQVEKTVCTLTRRGAGGGKARKVPRSTFLEAKGLLSRSLFPWVLRERGPSKKRACFLEGAAWNFSWLAPLGPRLIDFQCERKGSQTEIQPVQQNVKF